MLLEISGIEGVAEPLNPRVWRKERKGKMQNPWSVYMG
jgi:hypothetical protein